MNPECRKSKATLLLIGLVVLIVPLLFFSNILRAAFTRNHDTSVELLREKILHTAESANENFKPQVFVRKAIVKVHKVVMPDVVPEIANMTPTTDFGKSAFNQTTPQRFARELEAAGLMPLLIVANPADLSTAYHWAAPQLVDQCPEIDKLAEFFTGKSIYLAARIYRQNYQKDLESAGQKWNDLYKNIGADERADTYKFLSRFGQLSPVQDSVLCMFTDYFGQQILYFYTYCCVSHLGFHGSYTIIIPQSSLNTAKILENALQTDSEDMALQVATGSHELTKFTEKDNHIEHYFKPATQFWNHYSYARRQKILTGLDNAEWNNFSVRISAKLPEKLLNEKKHLLILELVAKFLVMLYLAFAMHYYLFGLKLFISIKAKLSLILGLIILLPIITTGLLAVASINDSDRLVNDQVFKQTTNALKKAELIDEENQQRLLLATMETRKKLETEEFSRLDNINNIIFQEKPHLLFRSTIRDTSACFSDGLSMYYSKNNMPIGGNKLITGILSKYMLNLGTHNQSAVAKKKLQVDTFALGLLEDFLTPELEEERSVHEGTIQREITHTADTNLTALMVIKRKAGDYVLTTQGFDNSGEIMYEHLATLINPSYNFFHRIESNTEINLAIRLRRSIAYNNFAWPARQNISESMSNSFFRAMKDRDSGELELRNKDNLEINAWSFKTSYAAVHAVQGKSRGTGENGLLALLVVPLLCCYALLLLYYLNNYFSHFLTGPLNIINKGIEKLNHEFYGVTIDSFSHDEFDNITSAFNEMSIAIRQREMIKRYVSDRLVEHAESGTSYSEEGQVVKLCILAADIRGFTTISEQYNPAEIVEMLNSYFTAMETAIQEAGGVIDKYIGDAIQAVFYNSPGKTDAAQRACQAAVAMRRELFSYNVSRNSQGLFPIENGIGLATGDAISGSIGREGTRRDYAIFGAITEQAANLESETRNTETRILVCSQTRQESVAIYSFRPFAAEMWELIYE